MSSTTFVKSFNIFGTDARQIPCLTDSGKPGQDIALKIGLLYIDEDTGDMYKCIKDENNTDALIWDKAGNSSSAVVISPLVLDTVTDYTTDSSKGDEALEAILRNRQIFVKVPDSDGSDTAIYSPVMHYTLPDANNNYLYLFYMLDEKQDLITVLDRSAQMPLYGQLKMSLSKIYSESPLLNPQDHMSDIMMYLKGDPGRGIQSINRTSGNGAAGSVDTYTINYTDGTTGTYQVYNGADGENGITPHIGSDGNWYLGDTNTNIKAQGVDGISVSSVQQTTASSEDGGSNIMTIKLSNGNTSTFTVKNGNKGYTPVKGTDYFTNTDKEEIIAAVIASLPVYNGEVEAV